MAEGKGVHVWIVRHAPTLRLQLIARTSDEAYRWAEREGEWEIMAWPVGQTLNDRSTPSRA